MKVIFEPCAQNTIIRPLAQAVCIANGGEPVKYIDTADHKEKIIVPSELQWLDLKTIVDGQWKHLDGLLASCLKEPVQVQVNVNDVEVMIDAKTTVEQAMAQFNRKLKQKDCVAHRKSKRNSVAHQRIKD